MFMPIKRVLRTIEGLDLSDLTSSTVTGEAKWVHDEETGEPIGLEIPFDVEPSTQEKQAILLRLTTENSVEETLVVRARQALTVNQNYLALQSPTAQEVTAQVKALTRECSALIRILLRLLDSAD